MAMSLKSSIHLAMQIFLADWSAFGNEKQSISNKKIDLENRHVIIYIMHILHLLSTLAFLKLLQNAFRI